jgi:hypothetical protein
VSLTGHRARQHTLSPVRQQDVDPLPSSVVVDDFEGGGRRVRDDHVDDFA